MQNSIGKTLATVGLSLNIAATGILFLVSIIYSIFVGIWTNDTINNEFADSYNVSNSIYVTLIFIILGFVAFISLVFLILNIISLILLLHGSKNKEKSAMKKNVILILVTSALVLPTISFIGGVLGIVGGALLLKEVE